jgi:hypothetical protein
MSSFRRDNAPPRQGPSLTIFRLKKNRGGTFCIFGSKVHGFWTHWAGMCSEPCTEPVSECVGHQREWPLRWKGYIHCYWQELQEEGFLELTPHATNDIILQLGGEAELRGARVRVERGQSDKARLKVTIQARWQAVSDRPVPEEKDPENTLAKLWEFGSKRRQPFSKRPDANQGGTSHDQK